MNPISERVLDPKIGLMKGLRLIPLDPGSPAIHCAATQVSDSTRILGARCHGMNGGAGLTATVALQAAVGETVERYCAAGSALHKIVRSTAAQLVDAGRNPLLPGELALFDEDAEHGMFENFTMETELGWVEGASLLTREVREIPACLVFIPYLLTETTEKVIGGAISTGLACHLSPQAAILRGAYEAIERDAFAIAWLNELPLPQLDVDSSILRNVMDSRFRRPGIEYRLFLAELDLRVPAIFSIITDHNFSPPLMCVGGAARLDPEEAALKAIVESVQGWVWARQERIADPSAGERFDTDDFSYVSDFDTRVKLFGSGRLNHAFDFLSSTPHVSLSSMTRHCLSDTAALDEVRRRVRQAGLDLLTINLTTPDVGSCGFHVVKVIIPGFEQLEGDHNFRQLGGSRWRTIPRQLNLNNNVRSIPNPVPHPYP